MTRKAELRQAYVWTCEDCGRDNFARAVTLDPQSDGAKELMEEHGIMAWETGMFVHVPDTVTCDHCGAEYDAQDERDGESIDGEGTT